MCFKETILTQKKGLKEIHQLNILIVLFNTFN